MVPGKLRTTAAFKDQYIAKVSVSTEFEQSSGELKEFYLNS